MKRSGKMEQKTDTDRGLAMAGCLVLAFAVTLLALMWAVVFRVMGWV